jgi:hypothetical protein
MSARRFLAVASKVLEYLSPIILGMVLYHLWEKDWITAVIIMSVLLILKIRDIVFPSASMKNS